MKQEVTNWGNYPRKEAELVSFRFEDEVLKKIKSGFNGITRGNGRCYGDASLADHIISTTSFNMILSFDKRDGIFNCQSGLTLDRILEVIVPEGWFLPVTPGTKFITIGGALACDVHGKNHHKEGTFADHVLSFNIVIGSGEQMTVSRESHPELFNATAGGMGLTGVILSVQFKLKRIETSFITQKKIKARNLDEAMALFEANVGYTYSMSWIDCMQSGKKLGRSVLMVGEHSKLSELSDKKIDHPLTTNNNVLFNMPVYLPAFALNSFTIKTFNLLYYGKEFKKESQSIIPYDPFFYPLDAILNWNRMYGKPGFVQYQMILPMESSKEGLELILKKINDKGMGSFLAVLKLFGEENQGYLSFPFKGYTLALDFPVRKGLFKFLDELDAIVKDFNGRIYLTKDARMKKEMFESTYPRLNDFLATVKTYNPGQFASLQSDRLMQL